MHVFSIYCLCSVFFFLSFILMSVTDVTCFCFFLPEKIFWHHKIISNLKRTVLIYFLFFWIVFFFLIGIKKNITRKENVSFTLFFFMVPDVAVFVHKKVSSMFLSASLFVSLTYEKNTIQNKKKKKKATTNNLKS